MKLKQKSSRFMLAHERLFFGIDELRNFHSDEKWNSPENWNFKAVKRNQKQEWSRTESSDSPPDAEQERSNDKFPIDITSWI
jgi:hypothetical protein